MTLAAAREAVLRDLGGKHVDLVDRAVADRQWWLSQWAEGEPFVLCLLAQDVQEAVHETDPTWPLCADHHNHALLIEPDLGTDPFWVCPTSGLPVAPVGSLRKLA
ncbi:MAG: hypothetical protein JWM40_2097 [Frankiales bacterium]|nr:hypothetical protein [Frankiales bacterium]